MHLAVVVEPDTTGSPLVRHLYSHCPSAAGQLYTVSDVHLKEARHVFGSWIEGWVWLGLLVVHV